MTPAHAKPDSRPTPLAPPARWSLLDWLLLALVIGVAAWIRLTHIDPGLSFDELWHLASTQGIGSAMSYYPHDVVHHDAIRLTSLDHERNLWHVWTGMDGILHPPLYIVALRLWREVAGESNFAAHAYSIVCGLLLVGFSFATVRQATNRVAATIAALAYSTSLTQVYFSQEVRAYAMLTALGAIALWLMTKIELEGPTRRRLIWLAVMTLPLMLTHYFAVGGCLAIGVYGLLAGRGHRKAFLLTLAGSALVYAVIWLPFALQQLDDLNTGDAFLKSDRGPLHVLLLLGGVPFRLLVDRDYEIEPKALLSVVLFILPWFLVRRLPALRPWALWLCAAVLPILVLDLARDTVHSVFIRYLAIATPPIAPLFIGTVWAIGARKLSYCIGVTLAFVGAIFLFSGARVLLDADDFTQAIKIIEPRFTPGDAVVTASGVLPEFYTDAFALTLSNSPRIFPTTLFIASKPLTEEAVRSLGTRSVWLVCGELNMPVETFVPGARVEYTYPAASYVRVWHLVIDPAPTSATQPAPE